jgi:hypothetical protein
MDVVRMKYEQFKIGDRYSAVILVDEEQDVNHSIRFTDLFDDDLALLLIRVSVQSRNIFVYESYQIDNPNMECMVDLMRDFGRTYLKKKVEALVKTGVAQPMTPLPAMHVCADPSNGAS